jgi:GNAT superfamily N-acetyltransferase
VSKEGARVSVPVISEHSALLDPRLENVIVDYLANHLHLIEQLARLSWSEWKPIYQERRQSFDDAVNNYRERTNTDRLPLTLVALHGAEMVGTVSLKYHDLDIRPGLDPWLGALLVLPAWRGRGAGTLLMRRAVAVACALDIPQLFLWTSSAEGLYLKLGWEIVERTDYCGKSVAVMRMDTGSRFRT